MSGKLYPLSLHKIFGRLNNAKFTSLLILIMWVILTATLIKVAKTSNLIQTQPEMLGFWLITMFFMMFTTAMLALIIDKVSAAIEEIVVNLSDYNEFKRIRKEHNKILITLIIVVSIITIGYLIYLFWG